MALQENCPTGILVELKSPAVADCPTGILVDLRSPAEKSLPDTMNSNLKLSDFAGGVVEPFIEADIKKFSSPTVDLKTLSPSTMSTISKEASKLVSRLKMEDQQQSYLLTDEVFPTALSFDDCSLEELIPEASPSINEKNSTNVEFKKSPDGISNSHIRHLFSEDIQNSSPLEATSKPHIDISDVSHTDEIEQLSPSANKKNTTAKTLKSNLRELKKHSFIQKGQLSRNKNSLPEPVTKKQLKSTATCKLNEYASESADVVTISDLNKSLVFKSDSPVLSSYSTVEKSRLSKGRKSSSKITPSKQFCTPESSKSTKSKNSGNKENQTHDVENVYAHRFLPRPKTLVSTFCPEANRRQALSPLKNLPTPRSIKREMRPKLFLEKTPVISRQSFLEEEQKSHVVVTRKLMQPKDVGAKKEICKISSKVLSTSSYAPRQSISAEVNFKELNTPKPSLHQRNDISCTPISYSGIKAPTTPASAQLVTKLAARKVSHKLPEYTARPNPEQKHLTSKSGRINSIIKTPGFTTPLKTPRSSIKLSTTCCQRLPPPLTPLSSKDESSRRLSFASLSSKEKLSRRLSFVPSHMLSVKK